jgi:probable DNA metabolism protein
MQVLIYDGSFKGWLCAVFDVYEYKFADVHICTQKDFKGNIFEKIHLVNDDIIHAERVWKGLQKKLSPQALHKLQMAFLTEQPDMPDMLLQYATHVFSHEFNVEADFGHPSVLAIVDAAKKAGREKHRMEAFVRFQKTKDELYFSLIEPDFNVLPLIEPHFKKRYADQRWLIYDEKRKYGLFYDMMTVNEVSINFAEETQEGNNFLAICDEEEELYQRLWHGYFNSVNIPARKNTRLHIRHMPTRYWKYLPEKTRGLRVV